MDLHEEQVNRAEEASHVLNNPLFKRAFDDTRQALMNTLADMNNLRDDRARDVHAMVKALEKVKRCLEVHIETGLLARKEIEGRSKLTNLFSRRA